MTLNRRIGLGFTLSVDPAGGTSYTSLGAVVDGWDESGAKADMADISILVDAIKPKAKGQVDPGEISYEIAYDPDEGTTTTLTAMLTGSNVIPGNFRISYPSGTNGAGTVTAETFKGFVSGLKRKYAKDKLVVMEVTITKSGNLGLQGSGA